MVKTIAGIKKEIQVTYCKNIKFVLNPGMVISVASSLVFTVISLWYNWWSIFPETIVCITTITICKQKDVCTITSSFLFLRILTTNYSDTHHRESQ